MDPARMVRTRDWKYTRHGNGYEELFDLKNNSIETVNHASDPACIPAKSDLIGQLKAHMKEINDPAYAGLFEA